MTLALLIILAVGAAVKWIVLTTLVWIMIKIQKMNYSVLGLFASTAASILVSFIPVVGPYLACAVLVFALWKCTKADIAPDVIFTVAVSNALLFCFNLFLFGALMGDLRPDLQESETTNEPCSPFAATAQAAAKLSQTVVSAVSNRMEQASGQLPESAPVKISARTKPSGGAPDPGVLSLKGISLQSTNTTAIIVCNQRVLSMVAGESALVRTPAGSTTLRCEEISETAAVVRLGSQRVVLRIHEAKPIRSEAGKLAPAGRVLPGQPQRGSQPLE
jgi:hypothetical protein